MPPSVVAIAGAGPKSGADDIDLLSDVDDDEGCEVPLVVDSEGRLVLCLFNCITHSLLNNLCRAAHCGLPWR